MSLGELSAGRAEWTLIGSSKARVTEIQYDSRLVTPGCLFVALEGGYADGHNFVDTAMTNGAAAVMVNHKVAVDCPQIVVTDTRADLATVSARFFGNPSHELHVIGITGTDGKTTTSYLVDHILRSTGRITGMMGTVSVRIGDVTVDHETRQTTPESSDIQRLLRQMANAGVMDVILEATSHGLDLHRLDHTRFEVAAVTNITQEHLEHHKTREAYWAAKARLFARVSDVGGVAVVNRDDAGAQSVLSSASGCRQLIEYSVVDRSVDLYVDVHESDLGGSRGRLTYRNTTYPFFVPMIGLFNVSNALAALGIAMARGVDLGTGLAALALAPPVPGRMAMIDEGQSFGVIVDYAHTPESLEKVLTLLRRLRPAGQLIVVFGSAGERDVVKRPIQGRVAATLADHAIITSEDPRFEDAGAIIDQIAQGATEAGGIDGKTFDRIIDRRAAIAHAFGIARSGDTVLLAGKGHEQSIIWNGVKLPWDEAAVARDILARTQV